MRETLREAGLPEMCFAEKRKSGHALTITQTASTHQHHALSNIKLNR